MAKHNNQIAKIESFVGKPLVVSHVATLLILIGPLNSFYPFNNNKKKTQHSSHFGLGV